ncbi:MAG: M48 family metallopeptidase [Bacilli bacterium]|nr:M48 family metallopeptidase [Bacilli bacterium]
MDILYNISGDSMLNSKICLNDIEYDCFISYKRIKRIYIRYKNGDFLISAPCGTNLKNINDLFKEKNDKILELIKKDEDRVHNINLNEGSIINLIGVSYYIIHDNKSFFDGNNIYLDRDNLKNSLLEISRELLENFVKLKILYYYGKFGYDNKDFPKLKYKLLKSKFGHYNRTKNEILLNYLLVFLDEELIEYVIVHELAHMKVFNHSSDFYLEIKKILPNYLLLQKKLKKEGIRYENYFINK